MDSAGRVGLKGHRRSPGTGTALVGRTERDAGLGRFGAKGGVKPTQAKGRVRGRVPTEARQGWSGLPAARCRPRRVLSEQEQLAGLHLGTGLQPVKVDAASQFPSLLVAAVPLEDVRAGFLHSVYQGGYPLTQQVVDR